MPKIRTLLWFPFRVGRWVALGLLVASSVALGPHVVDAVRIFVIRDEPAARLSLAATLATPEEIRQRAGEALRENDPELAESLSLVAADQGRPFPTELLASIAEAKEFSFTRSAAEFWRGATAGRADTPTAFAAAMAADLTVVGDARDLAAQISKMPDQDNLTLFLAAAGVAMTANTVLTQGAAIPVKAGVSILKAAKKLNKLPPSLEEDMVKLARRSIDDEALLAMRRRIGDLDVGGLVQDGKRLVRPEALKAVGEAAGAVSSVSARQGYRATMQTLENAGEMADLKKLGIVSEKLGPKYRATLALRKGMRLTVKAVAILLQFAWLVIGAAIWVACAVWTLLRFLRKRMTRC